MTVRSASRSYMTKLCSKKVWDMVNELRDYIIKQIENLPEDEQRDIALELSGDLAILAESYD